MLKHFHTHPYEMVLGLSVYCLMVVTPITFIVFGFGPGMFCTAVLTGCIFALGAFAYFEDQTRSLPPLAVHSLEMIGYVLIIGVLIIVISWGMILSVVDDEQNEYP